MSDQQSPVTPEPERQPAADPTFQPAGSASPAAAARPSEGFTIDKAIVPGLIASALVIIGSLGTWATAGPISVSGGDRDGIITLIAAILAIVALFLSPKLRGLLLAAALVIVAVAVYDTIDVLGAGNDIIDVNVGWGLWLTLLAGIGLLVVAIQRFRKPAAPAA